MGQHFKKRNKNPFIQMLFSHILDERELKVVRG